MNKIIDEAIVLKRVNFGEKDRILTVITKQHGRQTLFAKNVRASKSKLAGGVELMSVSNMSFIDSSKSMKPLVGATMIDYFEEIVKDIKRLDLAYAGLKLTSNITSENTESYSYDNLKNFLMYLNIPTFNYQVVDIWFGMHTLFCAGLLGELIAENGDYDNYFFDYEKQIFVPDTQGSLQKNDIKFMRLLAKNSQPMNFESLPKNIDVIQNIKNQLIQISFD